MKLLLDLIKHRFVLVFLALILQSCGGEDNTATPSFTNDRFGVDQPVAMPAEVSLQAADEGLALSTTIWPKTVIHVCWENPEAAPEKERQWVIDAVNDTWSKNSRLRFVGWNACAYSSVRDIRIRISDEGPYTLGLGTRLSGVESGMVLNFTYNLWGLACGESDATRQRCSRAIAVHEFGHALGFAHEQNRPDTPLSCTKPPQGTYGDTLIGPWDAESIMNYCNENVLEISNTRNLSHGDVQMVQAYYGDNYCNASPWHMYWNPELKDHFYSTEFFESFYGWEYQETQAYICQEPVPGTVPYYSYWNETTADHFYTQVDAYTFFGYEATGLVGHVFVEPGPRTKTLHQYWNPEIHDHFWTDINNPYGIYGYHYVAEEYFAR